MGLDPEPSASRDKRVDNPSVAPQMAVDPLLAILSTAGAAEASLAGAEVGGIDRQFGASLHTLREAFADRSEIEGIGAGVLRDEGKPRRGFVITTKGLNESGQALLKTEAEGLVAPFKVCVLPQEFFDSARENWNRERDRIIGELSTALSSSVNVVRVSGRVRPNDGQRTNGVIIVLKDPSDPSMTQIMEIVEKFIRRPMYPIYLPLDHPDAGVQDTEGEAD